MFVVLWGTWRKHDFPSWLCWTAMIKVLTCWQGGKHSSYVNRWEIFLLQHSSSKAGFSLVRNFCARCSYFCLHTHKLVSSPSPHTCNAWKNVWEEIQWQDRECISIGCKNHPILGEAKHCFEKQLTSNIGHQWQLKKAMQRYKIKYLLVKCLSFHHPTAQELLVNCKPEV